MQAFSPRTDLPLVRRLEAVGFRAWPAASTAYDGSWQVRLTGGHPSKRLNCVVPLDPSDHSDLDLRLEKARKRFDSYGRALTVRETPLAAPQLIDHLRACNWQVVETVDVMTVDLTSLALPEMLDYLPSHDVGRFVDAILAVDKDVGASKPAIAEILSSIKPPSAFFIKEDPSDGPVAVALCVQDNDLMGLMSFAVAPQRKRNGIGTEILASALRWARISGARSAWLQVVSDNEPAIGLYRKFGFRKAYDYRYWRPQG
ncbi:MAG: GNAT family N-acetyltransferase [Neorhizobium sp.]|jgi:ribosomal protein S18 acetylase RimI-like enzyme|nr:GNAT family N-acetyltransferase [Neorhizobium sp.]